MALANLGRPSRFAQRTRRPYGTFAFDARGKIIRFDLGEPAGPERKLNPERMTSLVKAYLRLMGKEGDWGILQAGLSLAEQEFSGKPAWIITACKNHRGVPTTWTEVQLKLAPSGRLVAFSPSESPDPKVWPGPKLTRAQARWTAVERIRLQESKQKGVSSYGALTELQLQLAYVMGATDHARAIWHARYSSCGNPMGYWQLEIDAVTGEVTCHGPSVHTSYTAFKREGLGRPVAWDFVNDTVSILHRDAELTVKHASIERTEATPAAHRDSVQLQVGALIFDAEYDVKNGLLVSRFKNQTAVGKPSPNLRKALDAALRAHG